MPPASTTAPQLFVSRWTNSVWGGQYFGVGDGFVKCTVALCGSVPVIAAGGLMDGVTEAITVGGAKNLRCFCSKKVFADLAKDLQNAVRYDNNEGNKSVGTKKFTIYSDDFANATLEISRVVNDNYIWGFDPAQIVKKSIGTMPHIDKEDGLTIARIYNSAGYESRLFQQAIFQVKNPAGGLRVQIGAVST